MSARVPSYVDAPRLCEELCITERTADAWVRQGKLPAPRLPGGLARWKWVEVQRLLRAKSAIGTIYFLQSGQYVKIGFTRSLRKRIKQLRTGNPLGLKLIHSMPGTPAVEAGLFRTLSHLHHRGEWFHDGPDLRAFLGLHLRPRRDP